MTKPNHTHLTRSLGRTPTPQSRDQTKLQMKYHMTAKLESIGVNPKSAVYEWSMEQTAQGETWTHSAYWYSAYWEDSKDKRSRTPQPLTKTDLIICARANANRGIEATASLCGYGRDLEGFLKALKQAGQHIGIKVDALDDLIQDIPKAHRTDDYIEQDQRITA